MPEIVIYKVRTLVEYTVVGVRGFADAVKCAEEKIEPALKADASPDLAGSYVREATVIDIDAERDK